MQIYKFLSMKILLEKSTLFYVLQRGGPEYEFVKHLFVTTKQTLQYDKIPFPNDGHM
jgi:hypothetical protein